MCPWTILGKVWFLLVLLLSFSYRYSFRWCFAVVLFVVLLARHSRITSIIQIFFWLGILQLGALQGAGFEEKAQSSTQCTDDPQKHQDLEQVHLGVVGNILRIVVQDLLPKRSFSCGGALMNSLVIPPAFQEFQAPPTCLDLPCFV